MNLTGLILSKALANIGCSVHVFQTNKKKSNFSTRTIGISKSNFDFINNNIVPLNKDNSILRIMKKIDKQNGLHKNTF